MTCKTCCFYGSASCSCLRIPGKYPPVNANADNCEHYMENKALEPGPLHLLNWRDAPACGADSYYACGTADLKNITCPYCIKRLKEAQEWDELASLQEEKR